MQCTGALECQQQKKTNFDSQSRDWSLVWVIFRFGMSDTAILMEKILHDTQFLKDWDRK